MSEKSITNLNLNSINISNSDFANAQGYIAHSNILATNNNGSLILNNIPVLTQLSSKIISLVGVPITVVVGTPKTILIDLFDYNFLCNANSLCTFSYIGEGSSIFATSIVFNNLDNTLTIVLNNDGANDIDLNLFVNLYNP